FIGYVTISRTHSGRDPIDLGVLTLVEDAQVLGEVIIQGQNPLGEMRGDTTSFNASAFKTKENGMAEDLIGKIPGVTISNGEVQAQGESVQKILVDGREFFGSDPNIALKNLPADAIDRIEILDQRSDQSRLTGFDDGTYTKTINIILREDRKNGQFGRVYGGYGTDDRYTAGGSLNLFGGDRRVSVLGLFNNINQQNFSSDDLAGVNANASGGGGRGSRGGSGGGNSNFYGGNDTGTITTNAFGLNFSDKFGPKVNFTGSYFFNNTQNTLRQTTNRQTVINETTTQNYQESLINFVENFNHRANARIEADLNDKNSLVISPTFSYRTGNTYSDRDALTLANDTDSLSSLRSITDALSSSFSLSNNITYRYKFDKKGRTLSTDINTSWNNSDQDSDLGGTSKDYNRNLFDTTLQQTDLISKGFTYRVNATLTEPLGEKSIGTFGYQISNTKTDSDQRTRVLNNENITVLDTALSNDFENKFITQRLRTGYAYNSNGWNVNLNLDYQYAKLDNESFFPTEGVFVKDFNNLLPSANLSYRNRESGLNFRFRYRTSTNEPSVTQLQNVVNNQNPLSLSVGNPNLSQSYAQNLNANIGRFNLEKNSSFFVFANFTSTDNYIGTSTYIASTDTLINNDIRLAPGGQITQPVNLDGNFNASMFMNYGTPIKGIKTNITLNTRVSFTRSPGIINGLKNINDNTNLGQGVSFTSNISKDFDFTLGTTGTYTIVNSSLQETLDNNYYIQESNLKLYYSPNDGKLFVGNTVSNSLYRGLSDGFNQSIWLWNIEAGYRFAKNNKAEVKLVIFDLLNQNTSISRTISDVSVSDVYTNVLTRYGLLTFTYIIGKFKSDAAPSDRPQRGGPPGGGSRTW
ncbi:outer membrane beta-barrel protein, partial [Algoriphagus ratkowskyi]